METKLKASIEPARPEPTQAAGKPDAQPSQNDTPAQVQQAGDQISDQVSQLLLELKDLIALQEQDNEAPQNQPAPAEPDQIRGPRL